MRWLLWLLLTGWAVAQEHLLQIPGWLPPETQSWQVSADGQRVLMGPAEHMTAPLELWDAVRGRRIARLLDPVYHVSRLFLPDGKVAALSESISDSGVSSLCAWVWDSQGQVLLRQPGLGGDFAEQEQLLAKDTLVLYRWENREAGDANGRQLWAEGQVKSWHWPSRKVRSLAGVRARLRQVALSADGRWLLTLGGDDVLTVWRPDGARPLARRPGCDRFQALPGQVLLKDRVLTLPGLKKARSWDGTEVISLGSQVFRLQGAKPVRLQPQSLQPLQALQLDKSPGFELSESLLVGKLSTGRLLLWDPSHRAVALTR